MLCVGSELALQLSAWHGRRLSWTAAACCMFGVRVCDGFELQGLCMRAMRGYGWLPDRLLQRVACTAGLNSAATCVHVDILSHALKREVSEKAATIRL